DRLMSATESYCSLGYSYDKAGNRLTQTLGSMTTQYQYKPNSNQLTAIITVRIGLDCGTIRH
ncbi:MAG: hypothetical protein JOZ29_12310, partial [Deltaproteobacteria bacterium]|nr:hypothetical protein [Deltaproteobacteria bacterium]